jgi:Plasmid pRiA4b ORF-3-like protein
MADEVFRLKVTLKGSRPPIWRRLEVEPGITLFQLHRVLQRAMGWTDSHLHQFWKGRTCYGSPDPEFGMHRQSERQTHLLEVFDGLKDRIVYEYDFGDGWEHDVVLEAVVRRTAETPRVLDGRGACPPEDVGGIGGYYAFLEAVQNPAHPEHEEMLEWHGPFDPEAFDVGQVNKTFRRRLRRQTDA